MAMAYRRLLDVLPERSEWSYEDHTSASGSVQRFVVVDDDGLVGPDAKGQLRLHAYEEGLHRWTRLHGELLKAAAAIGLEERRQAVTEEQIDRIGGAIVALVAGLGR